MSMQAYKRLNKEYKQIQAAPPPFIVARPSDANILDWHYIITGPPGTPYEGGQYHGRITFPSEYPFKPPRIKMCTPSGRFEINQRLCLSMSDFHEESWNPSWSVATIITGLLSFMTGDERTTGSIVTSESVKKDLAKKSKKYNTYSNPPFKDVFPEVWAKNVEELKAGDNAQDQIAAPVNVSTSASKCSSDGNTAANSESETKEGQGEIEPKVLRAEEIEDPEDKIRAAAGIARGKKRDNEKPVGGMNSIVVLILAVFIGLLAKGAGVF